MIILASSVLHAPAECVQITESGTATVTNSLLVKDSPNASTVFASGSGSRVSLVNNTLVGGTNGVLIDESARLEKLVNNVIAFHTEAGVALVHAGTASPDVRANDVFNPTASLANYVNMQDYTGLLGNISADPKFVDRTTGDYRLGDGSPALDAALGDEAPSTDLAGHPRFDDWGVPDTGSGQPSYADIGCHERTSDSTSPIDLIVVTDSITGPATATIGETVSIQWTIQNVGTKPAVGPWHDQVSLVSASELAQVETIAGEFLVGSGVTLLPGQTLVTSAQVRVPPVANGPYAWQVRTNSRLEVREGLNRLNNTLLDAETVLAAVPELVLGQPASGTFSADGEAHYYAIRMVAGQSIIATLDDADNQGKNDLYVRFGEIPSRSDYDKHTLPATVADRRLQFIAPFTGFAYVLVDCRDVAAVPGVFQITASLPQFGFDTLTPAYGGNVGHVTVSIRGAAMPADATPYLRGTEGQEIGAWPLQRIDATEMYATFDLTGQPAGLYDLVLKRRGTDIALSSQAFEVRAGGGPQLETSVTAPDEVRRGWIFPVTVEWTNTGDNDMASPMLKLANPAELSFSTDPFLESTFGSEVEFVGYSSTGPAGVLQPGDRESVTLWALASSWVSRYDFTVGAVVEEWDNPQPEPIKWAALEPLYRPPVVADPEEWAAVWQLFTQDLGGTWTDVVRRLADEVTQTGVSDGELPLVNELMQDALARAAGWSGQSSAAVPLFVQTSTPLEAADGSVSAVELTFNQAVAPDSFTADDIVMTAPNGTLLPVTLAQSFQPALARRVRGADRSRLLQPTDRPRYHEYLWHRIGPGSRRACWRVGRGSLRSRILDGGAHKRRRRRSRRSNGGAFPQVLRDLLLAGGPTASQPTGL